MGTLLLCIAYLFVKNLQDKGLAFSALSEVAQNTLGHSKLPVLVSFLDQLLKNQFISFSIKSKSARSELGLSNLKRKLRYRKGKYPMRINN